MADSKTLRTADGHHLGSRTRVLGRRVAWSGCAGVELQHTAQALGTYLLAVARVARTREHWYRPLFSPGRAARRTPLLRPITFGRKHVASARGCSVAIYGVLAAVGRSVGGGRHTSHDRDRLRSRRAERARSGYLDHPRVISGVCEARYP